MRDAGARRTRALLLATCLLALLLRLGTLPEVFVGGRTLIDGTDGYYHMRRALLVLHDFPHVPLHDPFLGPPDGGLVTWSAFDLFLAATTRLFPAPPTVALEAIGARLPVLLGLAQVLLAFALARRLAGRTAGLVAAFLAAVLPAAVRYTLLGALDHDPAVELLAVAALVALAGVLEERPGRLGWAALGAAAALAVMVLLWPCSEVQLGIVGLAFLGAVAGAGWRGAARSGAALALGGVAAAAVVLPFAWNSPWNDLGKGAFAGLSLLHVATLAALALAGASVAVLGSAALSRRARAGALAAGAVALVTLVVLLPRMLAPLRAGMRFVGGDDAFLAAIAECRPMLFLFGPFDPRPALVRLGALPLVLPALLVVYLAARPRRSGALGLLLAWTAAGLAFALLQVRYAHVAALALVVLGGVLWEWVPRPAARAAIGLALLPCLAAYVPLPGFDGLRLYGRSNDLLTTGMLEVTELLARQGPPPPGWSDPRGAAHDAVLADWGAGHWIEWIGRRPTVANPWGPYGQTGFRDAERFWLLPDSPAAAAILVRHRVRWIVAPTAPVPPTYLAALAGEDAAAWSGAAGRERFARSLGARLAWSAPPPYLREVYRTRASRRLEDGTLEPLLRVFEVAPARAAPGLTAPGRAPSGP